MSQFASPWTTCKLRDRKSSWGTDRNGCFLGNMSECGIELACGWNDEHDALVIEMLLTAFTCDFDFKTRPRSQTGASRRVLYS
jgi:hypothetical protein